MSNFSSLVPVWKTSSLGDFGTTPHAENQLLGKQLAQCGIHSRTLSIVQGGTASLHRIFVQHALTGVLLTTVVVGSLSLML